MDEMMEGSIDLSGLDTASVSWVNGGDPSVDLYAVAPGAGLAVTGSAGNGRSASGGSGVMGQGRPWQWCCFPH